MRPPPRRRRGRPREGVQPPLVQSHFGVRHGDPDAHERVLPAHCPTGLDEGVVEGGAARLGLRRVVLDLPPSAHPDCRLLRFHNGEPGPDDLVLAAHGCELPRSPGSVRPGGHPLCQDPRRSVHGAAGVPVLIYIWLPFMILPLFTAVLRIDPALIEAAQDLGAGSWKTFWNVVVPLSYNGILTGTILVFITAFGSFVEPKILAGSSGLLIGNYIQASFLEFGKLPDGAAASVVVLVPTIVLLYVYVAYAQAPATGLARESVVARIVRAAWGRLSALLALLPIARKKTHTGAAPGGPDPTRTIRVHRSRPEQLFDSLASWRGPGILRAYTFVALAAFYIPLIQVIIFSFNHDNNTIVWSYPSLRWYVSPPGYQEVSSLFGDTAMIGALSNSIGIGLVVTAISLAIGLPAALAIVRYRFSTKPFLNLMLYTGLMIPSIILGLSLLVFIRLVDDLYLWPYLGVAWDFGYASIIVGHVTFSIPIVIVVLIVSLREFDRSIEEAAMDLGANEITTFFRVTIPNIMPGIVSAALLAFTFSFSEVVVTLFLTGAGIQTLPILFWAQLSKQIQTPELNAASTLIIGLSIVFIVLSNKVQRGGTLFRF